MCAGGKVVEVTTCPANSPASVATTTSSAARSQRRVGCAEAAEVAVSVAVVMMEGVTSTCVGREAVAGTSSCRSSAEVEMKNQFRRKGGATVVGPP